MRIVKSALWSVVLYASETRSMTEAEWKRLEAMEMWIWRMEKISWVDSNEQVLQRVNETETVREWGWSAVFYMPDVLRISQPTVSKNWRKAIVDRQSIWEQTQLMQRDHISASEAPSTTSTYKQLMLMTLYYCSTSVSSSNQITVTICFDDDININFWQYGIRA